MSGLAPVRASGTARVFFALWPDEAVRGALADRGESMHRLLGGKLTRAESVHMTLLFLGDVPAVQVALLQALGARIAFEPFTLEVNRAGCWKHNKVAWVGPSLTPPPLAALVQALETAAEGEGLRFDHRPFAPHITLVRKARCMPLAPAAPIEWAVGEFVLVRSELDSEGSRYEVIARWGDRGVKGEG